MKRICAWCGQVLDRTICRDDGPVSHGICALCRRTVFGSKKPKNLDINLLEDDKAMEARKEPEFHAE
jgi:hypothetical protein